MTAEERVAEAIDRWSREGGVSLLFRKYLADAVRAAEEAERTRLAAFVKDGDWWVEGDDYYHTVDSAACVQNLLNALVR